MRGAVKLIKPAGTKTGGLGGGLSSLQAFEGMELKAWSDMNSGGFARGRPRGQGRAKEGESGREAGKSAGL